MGGYEGDDEEMEWSDSEEKTAIPCLSREATEAREVIDLTLEISDMRMKGA